eukprot:Selendium_serpulae@DN4138_c0_g1_i1.p1
MATTSSPTSSPTLDKRHHSSKRRSDGSDPSRTSTLGSGGGGGTKQKKKRERHRGAHNNANGREKIHHMSSMSTEAATVATVARAQLTAEEHGYDTIGFRRNEISIIHNSFKTMPKTFPSPRCGRANQHRRARGRHVLC